MSNEADPLSNPESKPLNPEGSERKRTWSAPKLRDLGDVVGATKNFPALGDDGDSGGIAPGS